MLSAREMLDGSGWRRDGQGQGQVRSLPPDKVAAAGIELDAVAARMGFWRNVRRITVMLLAVWLVVTLALPWFATDLNQFRIGRFPLGFWLTSQGAVGIYVVLIVAYIWAVEMIEDAWHDANDAATAPGTAPQGSVGGASTLGRRRSGD
ncbi:MAG: hypothetical protein RL375_3418 [Pseudomonadota bacterium]|jgi:putative solute:sodium symporter small subunit